MTQWNRRRFMGHLGVAAGSGLVAWNIFGSRGLLAQQSVAGIPDEIVNPVEVSGPEAEPILGKLPGQKRMYMLPHDAGEYHRVRAASPLTYVGKDRAAFPDHARPGRQLSASRTERSSLRRTESGRQRGHAPTGRWIAAHLL